jgi:hypothetical protein
MNSESRREQSDAREGVVMVVVVVVVVVIQ